MNWLLSRDHDVPLTASEQEACPAGRAALPAVGGQDVPDLPAHGEVVRGVLLRVSNESGIASVIADVESTPREIADLEAAFGRAGFKVEVSPVYERKSAAGGVLDDKRYAKTLRLALAKAKIDRPMRPFHDGRHTSITNAAAAGTSPAAPVDLSGEAFREEAQMLENRLWGDSSTKDRYKKGGLSPAEETESADVRERS